VSCSRPAGSHKASTTYHGEAGLSTTAALPAIAPTRSRPRRSPCFSSRRRFHPAAAEGSAHASCSSPRQAVVFSADIRLNAFAAPPEERGAPMKRNPVTSSTLASVGYDAPSRTLEIEFRNGRVYQYFDVPQEVYEGLLSADSVGRYFIAQIRDRYRYASALTRPPPSPPPRAAVPSHVATASCTGCSSAHAGAIAPRASPSPRWRRSRSPGCGRPA